MTKHSNFVIPWSNCVQLSRNALHLHDPMLPNECVLYMCNTCDKYSSSPIQRALRVTKYISVGANCQQGLVDQDKSRPCGDTFCHKISNWHPHPTKQSMYDAPLGIFWWFTLEVEATITFIWPECGDHEWQLKYKETRNWSSKAIKVETPVHGNSRQGFLESPLLVSFHERALPSCSRGLFWFSAKLDARRSERGGGGRIWHWTRALVKGDSAGKMRNCQQTEAHWRD